jgi:tetratricopeptide (TPR) repeat protein
MDAGQEEAFATLLAVGVDQILRVQDSEAFLAFMREAPEIFPQAFPPHPDPAALRAMSVALGYALWNATPLPRNAYRPLPLPKPQRNDPCPCGSGIKYKRCCAGAPLMPPFDPSLIWSVVLEQVPKAESTCLAREGLVPRHLLGQLARRWIEEGHPGRALRFLEPLFADPAQLDGRYEEALDALLDAYDGLGRTAAKLKAIKRLLGQVRPPLRAALWMRLAGIAGDQGDRERSWECFRNAQADAPEDPNLSHLEIILLLSEGQSERAAERARYWVARLRRQGFAEQEPPLPFLRDVAAAPDETMALVGSRAEREQLERFLAQVRAGAGRPLPVYGLAAAEGKERTLEAPRKLERLEQRWQDVFPLDKPFATALEPFFSAADVWDPQLAGRWLEFLETHPQAFDSLEVLDDLCLAIDQLEGAGARWVEATFLAPLVERGEAILRRALERHAGAELPWGWLENRPALRLAFRGLHFRLGRREHAAATSCMEWLLALNPNDNHGVRELLANERLRAGRDDLVLELADRFPDDFLPALSFGKVAALYRLGRTGDALAALGEVVRTLPRIPEYLLARAPKQPQMGRFGITSGGKEEAWLYRQEMLEVFQGIPGFLDWLRRSSKGLRRHVPPARQRRSR